ncbi:MAG TPA: DinB family protein [Chloroflexota bacterium]
MNANLAVLEELYDELAEVLGPLDEATLNWTPPAAESNSIAGLVRHIVGSNYAWLSRAVAETVARDRDAEFHTIASSAPLIALVEQARQEARRRFEILNAVPPDTIRTVRRLDAPADEQVSVAWCVAHAIVHSGEHLGQIFLTRDLYAAAVDSA